MLAQQMRPEFMHTGDEKYIRDVYAVCHPYEAPRPSYWYNLNPTLIVQDITMNNMIVGFTSFYIADNNGALGLFGKDVCVLPEYRGVGIAKVLHAARLTIGYNYGCRMFIGQTHDEAMARILMKAGAHKCIKINAQGDYLYMGNIEEV